MRVHSKESAPRFRIKCLVAKMDSPVAVWLIVLVTFGLAGQGANGASKTEGVIEDINARQLNKIIQEKDNAAIFWCKDTFQKKKNASAE